MYKTKRAWAWLLATWGSVRAALRLIIVMSPSVKLQQAQCH